MKLLFIVKALANPGGGAEKVLAQVSAGLAARGHDVAVVTSDATGSTPYYPLATNIKLHCLGIGSTQRQSGALETLRRMIQYRKVAVARRPDVVVAFMHSAFVPAALALIGTGMPVIASEHVGAGHYSRRPIQHMLLQLTPLLTRRITVVSSQIKESFGGWLSRVMVVVPNPVSAYTTSDDGTPADCPEKVLLSVGRLDDLKDHKTLIDAFGRVSDRNPDWILRIAGEGELREALQQQIEELGLGRRVQMPGAIQAIDREYQAADLFVLPSIYESFGLATAEALSQGLPAIGFADCPGTNELIADNVNGCLVRGDDRAAALADVLHRLMSNEQERRRLAAGDRSYIGSRYGLEGVVDQWENLLSDIVGQ